MGKPLDAPNVASSAAASRRADPRGSADRAQAGVATDALKALARAVARQAAREAFSAATEKLVDSEAPQRGTQNAGRS